MRAFVKGAPDVLIARSGSYWLPDGEVQPITDEGRQVALAENERIAQEGERVMVVARRDYDPETFDPKANLLDLTTDLTLLAMVGIVDPRPYRSQRRHCQMPQCRHPGAHDHRRPRRDRGGHRAANWALRAKPSPAHSSRPRAMTS